MTFTSLGRVNQPTPGTPIRLSVDPTLRVAKILIQMIPGLTGKAYLGTAAMKKATLVAVARVLWPNTAGGISDQFFLEVQNGLDELNLEEYYIDLDVAGEGVLVSYWTE
jgi:hypothetical protein